VANSTWRSAALAVFAMLATQILPAVAAPSDKYMFRYRPVVLSNDAPSLPEEGEEGDFAVPASVDAVPSSVVYSATVTAPNETTENLSSTYGGTIMVMVDGVPSIMPLDIEPGASLQFATYAPENYAETVGIPLSLGGQSATWNVSTLAEAPPDRTPNDIWPVGMHIPVGEMYESEEFDLTGFELAVDFVVVADSYLSDPANPVAIDPSIAAVSINGGDWVVSGTVEPGDKIKFRGMAPSEHDQTANYYLAFLDGSSYASSSLAIFSETRDPYVESLFFPQQIDIVDVYNAVEGENAYSEMLIPNVINVQVSISVLDPDNGEVSVEGGPWVKSAVINPGETFRIRAVAGSTDLHIPFTVGEEALPGTNRFMFDIYPWPEA